MMSMLLVVCRCWANHLVLAVISLSLMCGGSVIIIHCVFFKGDKLDAIYLEELAPHKLYDWVCVCACVCVCT